MGPKPFLHTHTHSPRELFVDASSGWEAQEGLVNISTDVQCLIESGYMRQNWGTPYLLAVFLVISLQTNRQHPPKANRGKRQKPIGECQFNFDPQPPPSFVELPPAIGSPGYGEARCWPAGAPASLDTFLVGVHLEQCPNK